MKIENCPERTWIQTGQGNAVVLGHWIANKTTSIEYVNGPTVILDWGTEVTLMALSHTKAPAIYSKLKSLENEIDKVGPQRSSPEFKKACQDYLQASRELRRYF